MMRSPLPLATLLLLALSGCVSKGRMELVEIQLEATRTALHARDAANQQRIRDLEDELRQQQRRLEHARLVAGDLGANMEVLQERLRTVQATEARLLEQVAECEVEREARAEAPAGPVPGQEPEEDGGDEAPMKGPAHQQIAAALAVLDEAELSKARVQRHQDEIEAALAPLMEAGRLEVLRRDASVVVRIGVHVLFQEHRVLLSPLGDAVLEELAAALQPLEGRRLRVEGHTDPTPHHSVQFASNWELGFGRAMTVLRTLEGHGLQMPVLAASFAGQRPVLPPERDGAKRANERVELRLTLDPALREPLPEPEEDADEDEAGDAPDAPEGERDAQDAVEPDPARAPTGSDRSPAQEGADGPVDG